MEINNFNEKFFEIGKKYTLNQIDKNGDGVISQDEVLYLIEKDEEVSANLSTSEISETVSVQNTDEVQSTTETQQVQKTDERKKVEIKTMEEYKGILDKKFDELWEKYGNQEEVIQYVKNNLGEYMDLTGDGIVDKIDLQILENYLKTLPRASTSDPVEQEKGRDYVRGLQKFAQEIKKYTYSITAKDRNSYSLEDVENYAKLGGKPTSLRSKLNISLIAREENWKERLLEIGYPESELRESGDLYKKITSAREFIKNNPENAGYAAASYAFKSFISQDYAAQAEINMEYRDKRYEDLLKDSSSYKEYMKKWPYCGMTQKEYAFATAYGRIDEDGHFTTPSNSVATLESDYRAKALKSAINSLAYTDINGDGKLDVDDLKNFSTEIDLDGDGKVSSDEKSFLTSLKKIMEETIYSCMTRESSYNATNIEDIVNYFENLDVESTKSSIREKVENFLDGETDDVESRQHDKYGDNWRELRGNIILDDNGEVQLGKHGLDIVCKTPTQIVSRFGYLDGTKLSDMTDGVLQTYLQSCGKTKLLEWYDKSVEEGSVEKTFLHYIKSADLSKEQLEEILNKINSSSSKVQSQLAEVKAVIKQKLATI